MEEERRAFELERLELEARINNAQVKQIVRSNEKVLNERIFNNGKVTLLFSCNLIKYIFI